MIKPEHDISLGEDGLINLDKSRRAFGLVMPKERNVDGEIEVMTEEEHANQSLNNTAHMSPEDRVNLLTKAKDKENANQKGEEIKRELLVSNY